MTERRRTNKCKVEGCRSNAIYAKSFDDEPIHCKKHGKNAKYKSVFNVFTRKKMSMYCVYRDCTIRSTYGIIGSKQAKYCTKHRPKTGYESVHKKCIEEGCKSQPSFNFPGESRAYCKKHSKDGMINVVSRRCKVDNCNILPSFNYEGEKRRLFCNKHKKDGMINFNNKKQNRINLR